MAKRGRKKNNPPTKACCIRITEEQIKLLRMWGHGDVSAGLRWLINNAAPFVVRLTLNEKLVNNELSKL